MKRMKQLIAMMMAVVVMASFAACGGTSKNENADCPVYKVGIVQYLDDASLNQIAENIMLRLDQQGENLGVHFEYKDYFQNGQGDPSVINQIISDLIADDVDVIVPIATPVAIAAQTATEGTDIPVVFSAVSNPVDIQLVDSMEMPGGNITGTSDFLDTEAIMDLMLAANPECDYVGLLYDVGQDSAAAPIAAAKAYLEKKGIAYIEKNASTTDEALLAAQSFVSEGVDAVFTPTDNTIMKAELTIYEVLANAHIPHYTGADSFALNGAFCGYGVDYAMLGVETADMIADLLVNNRNAADVPVKTFDNGIAVINTEICDILGYNLETIKSAFEPLCTSVQEIKTAEYFD